MGAATVNIPAIVLSGGPMLDGHYKGQLTGSRHHRLGGAEAAGRRRDRLRPLHEPGGVSSATSVGHCNTMGTALSMNSLAEALGMSLPGCAAIPGPYRERGQMAYATGRRIVDMVHENLRPSDIMTRAAFENAILAASAIGASTNCPPHIIAIARHMGVELKIEDWDTHRPRHPAAGRLPAGRPLPRRGLPPRRRRAGGDEGAAGRRQAARRGDDGDRQDLRREPRDAGPTGPRGDPRL